LDWNVITTLLLLGAAAAATRHLDMLAVSLTGHRMNEHSLIQSSFDEVAEIDWGDS
jgi:hypothetical protein